MLQHQLCRTFCGALAVSTVPVGFAVSTGFILPDGDPATFYIREAGDQIYMEDDGEFLATAIASGLAIDKGHRKQLLDGILNESRASVVPDTLQIRSREFPPNRLGQEALPFLSALIRARDIVMLSQDSVTRSFADDLRGRMEIRFRDTYRLDDEPDADNPADIVMKDPETGLRRALVYAVGSNEKLLAALLRFLERDSDEAPVIAALESLDHSGISHRRYEMAVNRGLEMAIVGSSPAMALDRIAAIAARTPRN